MNTIPKATLILGYKEFYNVPAPTDRLSIVTGICKRNLITEFAALNYRLKPKNSLYYDTSLETQIEELKYFCPIDPALYAQYSKIASSYTKDKNDYPIIFTRQTCMFALEEIIQSDLETIEGFNMWRFEVWDAILRYILAVNSTITEIKEENEDNPVNFETLNPKLVPLNELNLNTDPFAIPYRAYCLFLFLNNHPEIGTHFKEYLETTYSIEYDRFVYEVFGMYLANKGDNWALEFAYNVSPDNNAERIFEIFSQRFQSMEMHKLLSIRKFPFYKSREHSYLLTDNILLLEKLYTQFINDFWFDYLKPNAHWNIKKYKAVIGYFFESYIKDIIGYCFQNAKHYVIKQFEELQTYYQGNQIEIADIYIRYSSKVILGQVKSTSLYDSEKYSGDLETFYKNNRDGFFNSFGVNQLVQSLKILNDSMPCLDMKFPYNKSLHVFPVIIFNEKALQTPIMAPVFQDRFAELLEGFKSNKIFVYPLSLIHVSDLERIQDFLHQKPSEIWELLRYHCRFSRYMPPFYNSLNRKDIRPQHKRTMTLYEDLIPKFSGEKNGI